MHKQNQQQPFTNSQSSTTSACSSTASASSSHSQSINFTQIDTAALSFVICDSPDDTRMAEYVRLFKEKGVTDVVRVCKPRYDAQVLQQAGIRVHEFYFEDGGVPGAELLSAWLHLVKERISQSAEAGIRPIQPAVIAVHCVAGLGRAPLLVAITLMEFGGLSALDAIELIRSKRRGSLNSRQIRYLVDNYAVTASGNNVNRPASSTSQEGKGGFLRQLIGKLF